MTTTTSRAEFLSLGAKGGLALVVGGSVLGVAVGPALGQAAGDVEIAKLAATAELLAVDVYSRAITTGFFTADVLAYMEAARQNEQDHYDTLAGVLGADAPKGLKFKYPAGTFASAKSIAATGVALETAFVGAYLGAVEALESVDLKAVAGQVAANEAQHLTTFKRLDAGNTLVPNPSFPESLTAAQATAAVTPFLA
ncbi:ferritin-like domain-containing protein [Miltoncostaea oceani]|jgi:rubrerythrin|uniref:ferritin-like domain-containing protein n=1 Tax=Miltoncostaea oceani TaxID=2843216 RepID=UPI001C3CBA4A|nr:ferritin-like domain-containing protein [Miltoncostaea oceani]